MDGNRYDRPLAVSIEDEMITPDDFG